MSDNKDYITQSQENGAVLISEDVIASITAVAAKEVDGVFDLCGTIGEDLVSKLGVKTASKGIKICLKESSVEIECNLTAIYGHSVIEMGKKVQTAVTTAVESMTGLKVDAVNVNICGISMGK